MQAQSPTSFKKARVNIERLLIVRLGAMGDIIHALPAVAALRKAFPRAVLGWVVEERWAELLCAVAAPRSGPRSAQRPIVDKLHMVNTKAWRLAPFSMQTWKAVGEAFHQMQAVHYEAAIDLQGAVRSALVARWSGASTVFGAARPWESLAGVFYTQPITTRGAHVVEQNLSLAEAVAQQRLHVPRVDFPYDDTAEQECERRLGERGITDFVLISPGAGWGAKQWPAERYGRVAKHLAKEGLKPLVNFGPGEGALALAVEQASGGAAERVACTVSQLIALTRRARLFIGGDSGPMHLAAALGIPVVGLFGPTNPERNGPFATRNIVLRSPSSVTSHARWKDAEKGLLEITPIQVVNAALQLLRANRG